MFVELSSFSYISYHYIMQQWFWLIKTVVSYLHPLNRKDVASNVNANAVSNINVNLRIENIKM